MSGLLIVRGQHVGLQECGKNKAQQITQRLSLSLVLFVPPTEDLVELFKLTEDKRLLVCQ